MNYKTLENDNIQIWSAGEVTLGYKRKEQEGERKEIHICNSEKVAEFIRPLYGDRLEYREEFYVVSLNNANKVKAWIQIGAGGSHGVSVDVKMILTFVLMTGGNRIILSHNHPSGNLCPSENDKLLTRKVKKAAETMDIMVIDHVIITADSHYSFADFGDI